MGEVFGDQLERIATGGQARGNHKTASVIAFAGIPAQVDGRDAVHPRGESARRFGRADAQFNRLSAPEPRLVELGLDNRRLASDKKTFWLAVDMTFAVTQNEADCVLAIRHISGSEEARLPNVLTA